MLLAITPFKKMLTHKITCDTHGYDILLYITVSAYYYINVTYIPNLSVIFVHFLFIPKITAVEPVVDRAQRNKCAC